MAMAYAMTTKRMATTWLAGAALTVGCGPVVDGGGGSDDGASSDGSGSATTGVSTLSTSASPSTTDGSPTTASVTTDVTVTATATVTTDPTTATVTTDPTTATDTGGGLPNDAMCEFDSECASGHCYVAGPLGGLCGECNTDADCDVGGCTAPNPLAMPRQGSRCNVGEYGGGCMSDDACGDALVCASIIDVPGIIEVATCSECVADADCDAGQLCAPDIAVVQVTGVKRCVAEGSLANGQSCDLQGSGDSSCASGHCALASVMGILDLGVCSQCENDVDCGAGHPCQDASVDLMTGLQPAICL